MPFKAADENNNLVYSFNLEHRPDIDLHCPHCETAMIPVWDSECVINHFRHKRVCPYESEPESPEHLLGKLFLFNLFKQGRPHYMVDLEKRIENRIADISIEWPQTKFTGVIEYQNSPISYNKIIDRTTDYIKNNLYYVWVFNKKFIDKSPENIMKFIQGRAYFFDSYRLISCTGYRGRIKKTFDNGPYLSLVWKPDYEISADWCVYRGKFKKIYDTGQKINTKILMIEDAL